MVWFVVNQTKHVELVYKFYLWKIQAELEALKFVLRYLNGLVKGDLNYTKAS